MRSLIRGVRPPSAARRDPAPSRLAYRIQRLMLTPGVRLSLRLGVPFLIVFALTSAFLSNERRRDALAQFVAEARASIETRPEFMINLMAIDGADESLSDDIREAVELDFPVSKFDLDLDQLREVIAGLDPVKSVSLRVRPGGILQVDVVERLPVVVWRNRDGIETLDETGAHVHDLPSRKARADLPLIAGAGADRAVGEALQLFAAARPIESRLRGLVRVGERRWDVVLDRGQRIMLPQDRPVRALERVIALNEARDLLERDIAVVDLRLGTRPTVRLNDNAVTELARIRMTNENGQ